MAALFLFVIAMILALIATILYILATPIENALHKYIEGTEMKWMNTEQSLPPATVGGVQDGKEVQPFISDDVLIIFEGGNSRYDIGNYDYKSGKWSLPTKNFDEPDIAPSHWMPLPGLPK